MLKSSVRDYVALFGRTGNAMWWQNAQPVGRAIWARNLSTHTQSLVRTAGSRQLASLRPQIARNLPKARTSPLRSSRRNFHNTSRLRDAKNAAKESSTKEAEPQGLSARLKKLSREYGWTAVGVYLALSVLDFPFCFLLVRIVGTDRIGEIEHWIVSNVKKLIPNSVQERWTAYRKALKDNEQETFGNNNISEHAEMAGWGVEEAQARNRAEASLGTQLALAYAIHKSFIFIRVPLTAAILPKVVKVLRSWGWNIGKKAKP
ncbi:hypothetical protein PFICI_06634 [Pestalotiopsis fici W106-1]|uniref:DUF1279 domain-containing protein n=1 Tax=Pestalotiopsis fici (strain W106-1 / CGMCC3.15140) TaxID=1229662 RepID=W3X894_PESFW|nr:uncharacterized protein PFICI_06634 [Pestalotiopsis fici W106-1]ETS81632.1 hypothetical protein PFICI_06634 [Pestalotiopsis fici W106-1]